MLSRNEILSRLREEIHSFNGFRKKVITRDAGNILAPLLPAFPGKIFPLGCVHEFHCEDSLDRAAGIGFLSVLLSSFIKEGVVLWIGRELRTFPLSLHAFSLEPSHFVFIRASTGRDLQWMITESLKCRSLAAVICEMPDLDFNTSRKFQLAVEESGVTAFIIRERAKHLNTTASTARWRISHLPSVSDEGFPGIGYPAWNIELLRLRNGRPASWSLAYQKGRLEPVVKEENIIPDEKRKTG